VAGCDVSKMEMRGGISQIVLTDEKFAIVDEAEYYRLVNFDGALKRVSGRHTQYGSSIRQKEGP